MPDQMDLSPELIAALLAAGDNRSEAGGRSAQMSNLWAETQRNKANHLDWNGFLNDNVGFRAGGGLGLMAGRGAVGAGEWALRQLGGVMPGWLGLGMMAGPTIYGAVKGDQFGKERARHANDLRAKAAAMEDLIRGETKLARYRNNGE